MKADSMVTNQQLYALISNRERRELRALAAREGVTFQLLVGNVLRDFLRLRGADHEGSVKA